MSNMTDRTMQLEELAGRLASPGEVSIEGWYTAGVPTVGIFVEGEMVAECPAEVARYFAGRLIKLPAPPALGRQKTDAFAHELLAICDALIQ